MIDFYLNRVEPVVLQTIVRATEDKVIHNTEDNDIQVRPDADSNKQSPQQGEEKEDDSKEMSEEEIRESIAQLNEAAKKSDLKFYFAHNKHDRELCIKILDKRTDRLIRIFGPSEINDMMNRLVDTSGILVDRKG